MECGGDPRCPDRDATYKDCTTIHRCKPIMGLTEAGGRGGSGCEEFSRACKHQVKCNVTKKSECDPAKITPPPGCRVVFTKECPGYGGIDPQTGVGATSCPTDKFCRFGFVQDEEDRTRVCNPGSTVIHQEACKLETERES